jgi:diguanylate cyclase (GGDEF)-like protein
MARRREQPASGPVSCRVLSVQPERVDTRIVEALLADGQMRASVAHAGTLAHALSIATGQEFDLALVDLMLPDARGIEALRRLKTLRPELALVVVSDTREACTASMYELGAMEVLQKAQITKELLEDALLRALRRRGAEAQAAALAFRDALTGLHNARYFHRRLAEVVAMAGREQRDSALFLADLDGFKAVNDERGHAAGDFVLAQTARRLTESVRGYDVLARLGGDEFAFLIHGVAERSALSAVAERVTDALRAPIVHTEGRISIGASIGIALAPMHGRDSTTLLHAADLAMYTAKARGGGHAFATHGGEPEQRPSSRVPRASLEHGLLVHPGTRRTMRVRLRLRGVTGLVTALRGVGPSLLGLDGQETALTLELLDARISGDLEAMPALLSELRQRYPDADLRLACPLSLLERHESTVRRVLAAAAALRAEGMLTGLGTAAVSPTSLAQVGAASLALDPELLADSPDARRLAAAMVALARALGMPLHVAASGLAEAERATALGLDEVHVCVATRPLALSADELATLSA